MRRPARGELDAPPARRRPGPEQCPWLIRLDRVVEGQDHHGVTEVVLRANNSARSLNEAVALDLLAAAGLASQDHGYAAVRVGDASVLRLVLEHPGDTWADRVLPGDGILYKAEATGDYTYRGSDPASYDEVFDQESGTASRMTVVAWDQNSPSASATGPAARVPGRAARAAASPGPAPSDRRRRRRADLLAGGVAATSLRTWSTLLAEEADGFLDAGTLEEERAAIAAYFD